MTLCRREFLQKKPVTQSGFLAVAEGEESACKARDGSNPWSGKFPWEVETKLTQYLPREPYDKKSLWLMIDGFTT